MTNAPPDDPEELMTTSDAARILGLSSDMVRVFARKGRLEPAVKTVRGLRLFRRADVERLAAERRTSQTRPRARSRTRAEDTTE